MSRAPSDEGSEFNAAIETVPQWLVTMINLAGALTIALLRM